MSEIETSRIEANYYAESDLVVNVLRVLNGRPLPIHLSVEKADHVARVLYTIHFENWFRSDWPLVVCAQGRIAKKLRISPEHLRRVMRGKAKSKRVFLALDAEIARIEGVIAEHMLPKPLAEGETIDDCSGFRTHLPPYYCAGIFAAVAKSLGVPIMRVLNAAEGCGFADGIVAELRRVEARIHLAVADRLDAEEMHFRIASIRAEKTRAKTKACAA